MKIDWQDHYGGTSSAFLSILQLAADCALAAEGVRVPCAIGLRLVGDGEIQSANREFRGIDKATDVLSFPLVRYPRGCTAGRAERQLRTAFDDELNACMLGDILLSVPHAISQAAEYGHSLEREAAYLMVHGVCHLMGYDHMEPNEQKEMREMEEKALHMIGVSRETEKAAVSDESLLALARQAMERAYVPYSHFPVGAALLSADGRIFQGCNVENASFGLTNCAERTAVYKAVSEGAKEFSAIAIACAGSSASWPCGACRQVLCEFAPQIRVLVTWGNGSVAKAKLTELLPHSFGPKDLEKA